MLILHTKLFHVKGNKLQKKIGIETVRRPKSNKGFVSLPFYDYPTETTQSPVGITFKRIHCLLIPLYRNRIKWDS